jgi:hypothetical protein
VGNIAPHPLQAISPLDHTSATTDYTKMATIAYPSMHTIAPPPPPIAIPANGAVLETPISSSSTSWLQTPSDPSSLYSGSPTVSDKMTLPVHAPQPQHLSSSGVQASFEMWKDYTGSLFATATTATAHPSDISLHLNALDMSAYVHALPPHPHPPPAPSATVHAPVQAYANGAMFDPASCGMGVGAGVGAGATTGMMNDITAMMGFAIRESY